MLQGFRVFVVALVAASNLLAGERLNSCDIAEDKTDCLRVSCDCNLSSYSSQTAEAVDIQAAISTGKPYADFRSIAACHSLVSGEEGLDVVGSRFDVAHADSWPAKHPSRSTVIASSR